MIIAIIQMHIFHQKITHSRYKCDILFHDYIDFLFSKNNIAEICFPPKKKKKKKKNVNN